MSSKIYSIKYNKKIIFLFSLLWFPVTTPCGHVFCRECLIRSVDNTQSQCPICKSSLEDVCI